MDTSNLYGTYVFHEAWAAFRSVGNPLIHVHFVPFSDSYAQKRIPQTKPSPSLRSEAEHMGKALTEMSDQDQI